MPTYGKSHNARSVQFDSLSIESFDTVASVAINTAITSVQSILLPALDFKVFHVAVGYTAIAGAPKIQIGVGTGNLTGATVGTTDTPAPANTILFSVAPTLTAVAGIVQTFYPDNFDVIYQGSNASLGIASPVLTLRVITGGSDTITNLKVSLGTKVIDQHSSATMLPTPLGNYSFDPSTF
jgi:hypothetical protein